MSDGIKQTGIDIGELAKPADTLVKKIAKGVGGIFQPWQVKRVAKAEAEAALIKAQGDIAIGEVQRRAVHRFIEEEANHQANMESIAGKAIPLLEAGADADKVDDDWITNFFDKCRIVSDEDMQVLWSKLLAGEVNYPGSISRRTVNAVADFDGYDCDTVGRIHPYTYTTEGNQRLGIFNPDHRVYGEVGDMRALIHLQSIGLVVQSVKDSYYETTANSPIMGEYFGEKFEIPTITRGSYLGYAAGDFILTTVGSELTRYCDSDPVDGFIDYLKEQMSSRINKPEGSK